jgi:predicted AAA+ superfamily ATPase
MASGRPRALYYFRDQQGLEVDFIVPAGDRRLVFIETKASRTVVPAMAQPMERLAQAKSSYKIDKVLIHRESKDPFPSTALKSGVRAIPISRLGSLLELKE